MDGWMDGGEEIEESQEGGGPEGGGNGRKTDIVGGERGKTGGGCG